MKKIIYSLINKLGYRIENKKKKHQQLIKPLDKFKSLDNFNILILAKNYILNLDNKFDNLTIKNHKDGFLVGFLDLGMYVESLEEFHILNEVFVNNDYNYLNKDASILIDIGANIGTTSLFFSRFDYIEKIYAFEPLKDTFEQAQYNFALNDKICKVAWIKNIGLGRDNRQETFLFNRQVKGNTGVRGNLSPSYSDTQNSEKRTVQICDASTEIKKVLKEVDNKKIIIKMDCEGAEYEILENLSASKVINKIDVLLLEWHDKGAASIENILSQHNFDSFSISLGPISGMIYAKKK